MPVDRFPDQLPNAQLSPNALLSWYDRHARTPPWRLPPRSRRRPDPYAIWLSEIMAQQTRLAVAARYWQRFLALWPTVDALAAADDAEVMREWAGLGYYARARNLIATARAVAASGGFPDNERQLRQLPGIGPYTAAAIAAIAFGERVVAVDSNVARVAARLFAIDAVPPALADQARARLSAFVPQSRPGDFTQALMDLGATICTPRAADCPACPLRPCCAAYRLGAVERYPARPDARPRPRRQGLAWWIEHRGEVALVRRPPRGLLGGMPALPGTPWSADEPDDFPFEAQWRMQPFAIRHVFTHFELTLRVAKALAAERPAAIAGQPLFWVPVEALAGIGLPGLYLRVVKRAAEDGLFQEMAAYARDESEGSTSSSSGRLRSSRRLASSAGIGRPK